MRRVFEATASDGTVFKRSSDTRFYTHCVAIWHEAVPERVGEHHRWPAQPAGWGRQTQWASRFDLAQKAAGRELANGLRVEILEAREVTHLVMKPGQRWAEQRRAAKDAADTANADRIDGFDRDDLGESPDY